MAYLHTPAREDLLIRDCHVVDVVAGTTTAHQDVHIRDGRIAAVGEHDPRPAADGVRVVAGEGLFVTPAFVDAHCHPLNHPDEVDASFALMLTAGIAGYRQMSGSDELLRRRAAGTLRAPVGAPRLLALPGDLLTPLNASDVRSAQETVRHQAEAGADFVKAGFTTRETFLAALRTAREVGLPLAGHLPEDIDPREASREGVRCMEHLGTGRALFAASSPHEQQARAAAPSLPRLPRIPGLGSLLTRLTEPLLLTVVVNPAARTSEKTAETYRLVDSTFDEDRARELAALLCENQTWQCPTLIRVHTQQLPAAHRDDERARYIHPDDLAQWRKATDRFERQEPAIREALAAHWQAQLRLTRILAEAGVPMLTGTDASGAGWVIPGLALHDEFDLLHEAGLGAAQILRMATCDAARFFGREEVAGQVRAGFEADLVLLREDPTAQVQALHAIEAVVRDGALFGRPVLDEALDALARTPAAR